MPNQEAERWMHAELLPLHFMHPGIESCTMGNGPARHQDGSSHIKQKQDNPPHAWPEAHLLADTDPVKLMWYYPSQGVSKRHRMIWPDVEDEDGPLGKQAIPRSWNRPESRLPCGASRKDQPCTPHATMVDFCSRELADNDYVLHHLGCHSSSHQLIRANHLALMKSNSAFFFNNSEFKIPFSKHFSIFALLS